MAKPDPILTAFGESVRNRRKAKSLSQERLAERASLDPTYISGIERGVRNPGIRNVVRIAKALGITTAELCTGVGA
jgi:transcriptional regulator with XRE-family HTH domain